MASNARVRSVRYYCTSVVLVLTYGTLCILLAILCCSGTIVDRSEGFTRHGYQLVERYEHGWPMVMVVRQVARESNRYAMWDGSCKWNVLSTFIDMLTLVGGVACLSFYILYLWRSGWRLQVSIRSMLLTLLFVSVLVANLRLSMLACSESRRIANELRNTPGVSFTYGTGAPVWVRRLAGSYTQKSRAFDAVVGISLDDCTDEQLESLIPTIEGIQLRTLLCQGKGVTDRGALLIFNMSAAPALERVSLSETSISDDVEGIAKCRSLRRLYLDFTQVGDRTLSELTQNQWLEYLGVSHSAVTSRCLRSLEQIPTLRVVDLSGTSIDPTEAKQYSIRSGCEVIQQ